MYETLGQMNVKQRISFNTCILVFKIKRGLVPEYISDRVMKNNNSHSYNLRNNGDFRLSLCKKTCTQRMLLYEGLMFNVPYELKEEVNFKRFACELKLYCKEVT